MTRNYEGRHDDDHRGADGSLSEAEARGAAFRSLLVSEQVIDFLVAQDYDLKRTDKESIGRAVSAFLNDSVMAGA